MKTDSLSPNVLVTGAAGQLGQSIKLLTKSKPDYCFTFIDKNDLNLCDSDAVEHYFSVNSFDYIINCAAYTAVDKAEQDIELAGMVNYQSVKQLAEIAKRTDTVLIHVSTDYVFNGYSYQPYIETDNTDPQSVYGTTKLKGELAALNIQPRGAVIRTSWVYSEFGNNFVKTMLRLAKERDHLNIIFDQVGTPTYASDLATTILALLEVPQKSMQLLHYSNEGVCSWYDFAKAIFEIADTDCLISPIETSQYPTLAKRPQYSVLNKSKIKEFLDIEIPYWKDSLKTCLRNLDKLNNSKYE
jgi:dTDP-4-dehydrorhamnose reductase